ncbi:Inhibitor of nuclear factor kappa-B kinase subunit beta [Pseudolycoriella hygida]|uniref:IkappaB kinase n=1 Tax=Pseudolycoriella hygida TaxID=35572 RepID=A0A9Q0S643_9DIPT|nr:Inhibitor of nuclear factor kappa-B kinase subunit beta [Pseudolycoriella hygida]
MDDAPFIGDWHLVKNLGAGGFGLVKLWQNSKTGQKIAIKKCQVSPCQDQSSLEKLRERWKREIQYMTHELKNENIVQGLQVKPDSFLMQLNKTSQLPVLVMEYCEGGDLRTALNEHHNTSGLIESEVRSVLKCLLSAISYLHKIKISHRDIKPENCVIKTNQRGEKIYKLTDLGYAKPIDRQSLVASLVGTPEYVAPELLITDKYSNSVDYWSFGVIAFEVIAGIRPFVPHMPLAQWQVVKEAKDLA